MIFLKSGIDFVKPKNSRLSVTSSNFSASNTVCGLINTSGSVTEGTFTGTTAFFTLQSDMPKEVSICCYSVKMAVNPKLTSIQYALNGVYNTISNAHSATTEDMLTYIPSSSLLMQYTFANAGVAPDIEITKGTFSTLATPIYSIKQERAIGKVTFGITLPRPIVRDGKLTLKGDFALLTSDTTTPLSGVRCMVSFNKSGLGSTKWAD